MPTIPLSDLNDARLKAIAVPLADTYDTVIGRLIDHYELTKSSRPDKIAKPGEPIGRTDDGTMIFSPANPPSLSFTTVTQIVLNEVQFSKGDTYWNTLMNRVILEAGKLGHDTDAIYDMLFVNAAKAQKQDNGYKYLPAVGLSVQGQDSNAAFRQAYELAAKLGMAMSVFFRWQNNGKAAYPNGRGYFEL